LSAKDLTLYANLSTYAQIIMTNFIKKDEINNNWILIDAENAIVGRLAAYISKILRGKNKSQYTPHMDNGDFVVVTNIEKIKFTGKKTNNKKDKWIKKINEINCGPVIFLGNEFFDALPIKQIYKKKKLFFEKYVALSNDNKKAKYLHKKANNSLIKRIQNLNLISIGNIIEYPIEALKFLEDIAKKINKFDGGLLTFDYGYIAKKIKIPYSQLKNINTQIFFRCLIIQILLHT